MNSLDAALARTLKRGPGTIRSKDVYNAAIGRLSRRVGQVRRAGCALAGPELAQRGSFFRRFRSPVTARPDSVAQLQRYADCRDRL